MSSSLPFPGAHYRQTERSPAARLVRSFIAGNYFYVLSAFLVILGCYLLMRSPLIDGTAFVKTFKSFAVLQGYELVVIATAIIIVRRLKSLSDAFTLFLVEIALLLDPTFYSNSFLTMIPSHGVTTEVWLVCGISLVAAIAKLELLKSMLGIRMPLRTFGAFVVAAAVTWVGGYAVHSANGLSGRETAFYMLGWAPMVIAILLPSIPGIASIKENGYYAEDEQRRWLPRLFMALLMGVPMLHYLESSQVYGIRFYWLYGAPLLLALAFLLMRRGQNRNEEARAFVWVDVLCGVSLLMSLASPNVAGKAMITNRQPTPEFITAGVPFLAAGAAMTGNFLYAYARSRSRLALAHVSVVGAAVVVYALSRFGVFSFVGGAAWSAIAYVGMLLKSMVVWVFGVIASNWSWFAGLGWIATLVLAWNIRTFGVWALAMVYSILYLFSFLPGTQDKWVFEILQALVVALMVLYHRFEDPRNERKVAAFLLVFIGLARMFNDPVAWKIGVVVVESAGLLVAGYLLNLRAYIVAGSISGMVVLLVVARRTSQVVNPALTALVGGAALFAAGILVTFRKAQILHWLDSGDVAAVEPQALREDDAASDDIMPK